MTKYIGSNQEIVIRMDRQTREHKRTRTKNTKNTNFKFIMFLQINRKTVRPFPLKHVIFYKQQWGGDMQRG